MSNFTKKIEISRSNFAEIKSEVVFYKKKMIS